MGMSCSVNQEKTPIKRKGDKRIKSKYGNNFFTVVVITRKVRVLWLVFYLSVTTRKNSYY